MISRKEDTITFAEEAYMSIRMSRGPDHTIAFAHQINFFPIFNMRNHFMGWHANNVMHNLRVNLGKPEIGRRETMLLEKLRNILEPLRHRTRPDYLYPGLI